MAPISYSYYAIGNLTSKSDFANSYSYPRARPNAVNSVALVGSGTANYGYDANGSMTTAQGNGNSQAAQDVGQLALKYDPYNKPFFIERNGKRSEFWYGPDDQRYFQLENGNQRTVYIDKLYEQIGSTIHKLYLGDYAVFTVDVTSAANSGINYLHKDRLGSIVSITDESGNLIANAGRSFDPFGKPREEDLADSNGITHAPMPDAIGDLNRPDITTRGFTGHEQLNNLSLTHMNGRVYDYNLGQFLSVDLVIQFPENSQSLNPYSYILNNPLSGTDPTGYTTVWSLSACMSGDGATSGKCDKEASAVLQKLGVEVDNGYIKLPTGGIINNGSAIDSILAEDTDLFGEECFGCVEKDAIFFFAQDSSLKRAGVDPYDLRFAIVCEGDNCASGVMDRKAICEVTPTARGCGGAIDRMMSVINEGGEYGQLVLDLVNPADPFKALKVLKQVGKFTYHNYKYWNRSVKFRGHRVFQRNDLIDLDLVDDKGRANLQRMRQGRAPIGPDGHPLELHHLIQRDGYALAEVPSSLHRKNQKLLHIDNNQVPSKINRSKFNRFRDQYWKDRAKEYE